MNRYISALIVIFVVIISLAQTSQADWPLYSKPEYRGRIIDAKTKQPIEGAVAVVLYYKENLIGGPGGPNSDVFKAREILTDANGEFFFPSHSSLHIITKGDIVRFIFYKPGYMASPGPLNIDSFLWEQYFSADEVGKESEIHVKRGTPASYKGPMGIVELKKAETSDERRIGVPSTPMDYTSKDLPLLFKTINADRKERGLEIRENE